MLCRRVFTRLFFTSIAFKKSSRFATWLRTIVMNGEAFMLPRRPTKNLEVLPDGHDGDLKFASWEFIDQGPNPEQSCLAE